MSGVETPEQWRGRIVGQIEGLKAERDSLVAEMRAIANIDSFHGGIVDCACMSHNRARDILRKLKAVAPV